MSDPRIRLLTVEDLDAAFALSSTAGWNQQLEDWQLMLTLAPAGAFAAVTDGRVVGTAIALDYGFRASPGASVSVSGGFAWIAMMLVDPAWRGRGVGRRLLDAAIDSVPAERPIRLDATPMGRPLYTSAGFTEEATLTRHILESATGRPGVAERGARLLDVRRVLDADMADVIACDRLIFGAERGAILRRVHERAPQYAHIAPHDAGPPQYCFGRDGRLFDQIGPVIARDEDGARALVSAALGGADGRALMLDLVDRGATLPAWLHSVGFCSQRPLFRMRRPAARPGPADERPRESRPVEFAVLGPEFG
jgi:GNAT superfamily N-acetyltransferase